MIIYQSKKKTFGQAFICIAASILFLFLAVFDFQEMVDPQDAFSNPVLYWGFKALTILCLPFTVGAAIFLIKKMGQNRPVLEITEEAFIDHSSSLAMGPILWTDMKRAYIKEFMGNRFLVIDLNDPDKYRRNQNKLQKMSVKWNRNLGYGDHTVSEEWFKKQATEFYEEFNKHFPITEPPVTITPHMQ
ncbi:MAG: hypothetical protein J6C26_09755 [Clostridia bacterium]|nr:hypothetical protein [Clostridia bacterium]